MNTGDARVPGPTVRCWRRLGGGAGALVQHSPLGFVVAFGAGIISFVSPCVLPLVPSYLSMMSGVGVTAVAVGPRGRRRRGRRWQAARGSGG